MPPIIRQNERSWGIEMIVQINEIAGANDLMIKRAGGESTVAEENTMFPDVILYGDREQSTILQGWELKMPDVPIENEEFIKNAQEKANMLGLNSCLIWNFTYAVLYERNERGSFSIAKQWTDTSHIRTREDVDTYKEDWERLLETVVLEVNHYFVSGRFTQATIGDVVSTNAVVSIIERNKSNTADELRSQTARNATISAYINHWWAEIKNEYERDEVDPYQAYAKSVLLNWTNRIVFAHLIKGRQNGAMLIDEVGEDTTPALANTMFRGITQISDFFNVFAELQYDEFLPDSAWADLVEFSLFLKENGIEDLDQGILQNILEKSVDESRRNINGQYTTPLTLADILVRLTVLDWTEPFMDCCCGTGTIPKATIERKKEHMPARNALEDVWASDKNQFPLQVANISMVSPDTINVANRIFKHNALSLACGESINVTDPASGEQLQLVLPEFGAVASNLPFVEFEKIPEEDKELTAGISDELGQRSDLYCYIAVKIADILKPGGRLGIITSNSWLGTEAGHKFVNALRNVYSIKQVHISGCGRWFKNADIVTTILILEKGEHEDSTSFFLWKASLNELDTDSDKKEALISSALLNEELDETVAELSQYSEDQMDQLISYNVSYNALFHKIDWLQDIFDKLVKINDVYTVFRGSRRGWDPLFYPKAGEHEIEPVFLKSVLKNARNINMLDATAMDEAFCCSMTIDELQQHGYTGALRWIEKFRDQVNRVGKPLPEVLKISTNMQWYEMKDSEMAEVFTMMNPDKRMFFAKFNEPSFINQRLIGLCGKPEYVDAELNHALLNSIITMFYIEASGFGRGLGVLDISKENIANCYMPNPDLFTEQQRNDIVQKFNAIKQRQIKEIDAELTSNDRIAFESAILNGMGAEDCFNRIKGSLLSLQATRITAREDI